VTFIVTDNQYSRLSYRQLGFLLSSWSAAAVTHINNNLNYRRSLKQFGFVVVPAFLC